MQRLCCLIIAMILNLLLLPNASFSAIGQFVDAEADCRLIANNGKYDGSCQKERFIDNNDVIETRKDISQLPIQWLSPKLLQTEKIGDNAYRVSLKKLQSDSDSKKVVSDLLDFASKASLAKSNMVTRSLLKHIASPGDTATLLPGYNVTFVWQEPKPATLLIRDEIGKEVSNFSLEGPCAVSINLIDAGLEHGRKYSWTVDDKAAARSGKIALTPVEYEEKILGILNDIGKAEDSPGKRAIMQATFLKYAPEIYSDELDYRWLIYELLHDGSLFSDDDKPVAAKLLEETGM